MAARSLYLRLNNLANPRKERVYRQEMDPFECYTEHELRSRYRFGREGLEFIVDLLAD